MTENWEQCGRKMAFDVMTAEMDAYIRQRADSPFRLIVGTDSQPTIPIIRFETVVILVSAGTIRTYNRRLATMGPMAINDRMLTETAMSLMVADAIRTDFAGRNAACAPLNVEIHMDMGGSGETRKALRAAMGMVTGAGFGVKVKPESWAASRVADRLTKQDRKRRVVPVYELVTAI